MQAGIVKVSRQFREDFDVVAKFYKLAELGELETARAAVRRDKPAAIVTFARLADAVRKGSA